MSYATIRDHIKAELEAIADIGSVHDYYRFLKGKNIKNLLFKDGELNAWFIRKMGEGNVWHGPGELHRTHLVDLVGVMAINDTKTSEITFLATIETVINLFSGEYTYGGSCYSLKPPLLKQHQHKNFAGSLCHYGIIQLAPIEKISL